MPPPTRRPLTIAQLKTLSESDLLEMGAHTVWHPMLPALSSGAQRTEVAAGKEWLEDLLGKEVVSFAYPHGAYDAETMSLVEEVGLRKRVHHRARGHRRGRESLCAAAFPADDTPIDVFEMRLEQIYDPSATISKPAVL